MLGFRSWGLVVVSAAVLATCNDGVALQNGLCSASGACPDPLVPSVGQEDGRQVCRCVAADTVGCGNGRVDPGEGCDDGNTTAGDGCYQCQRGDCGAGETRPCGPVDKDMVGVCRKGTQRCIAGAWEAACPEAVEPTEEACNGRDDDCDGMTDEGVLRTFYPDQDGDGFGASVGEPRQACNAPAGTAPSNDDCNDTAGLGRNINPGASELCDAQQRDENCNGTQNEGCSCPAVGSTQPCCGSRGTQTCQMTVGGSEWGSCSVQGSAELCNGMDDDCDTVVDNAPTDGGSLCAAVEGQLCTGSCNCPGGQTVCGSRCVTLGGSCQSGTGACRRQGTLTCQQGQPSCDAVPADAGTEVCNGVDDDCDGTTDEGTFVSCLSDADGDRYAARDAGTVMLCPDVGRPSFGNCPAGYVAPTAALDGGALGDCDDSNSARFQLLSVRTDADSDGRCVNATRSECSGAVPNTGARLATACNAADDCDDTSAARYQRLTVRSDADGDTRCVGASNVACVGAGPNPGTRLATTCAASDDCNDGDPVRYQLLSVRADADGDTRCVGAALNECSGASPNAGRRLPSGCVGSDDCNDGDAARFQTLSVRRDSDGDTYCTGSATNQCAGNSPDPGWRTSCSSGDDCDDGRNDRYKLVNVRNDADSDGYCAGSSFSACVGGSGPLYSSTFLGITIRDAFSCNGAGADCGDLNNVVNLNCGTVRIPGNSNGHCCCLGCGQANPYTTPFSGSCPAGYKVRGCSITYFSGGGPYSITTNDGAGTSSFSCAMTQGCGGPIGCEGSSLRIDALCDPCTFSQCP